MTEIEVASYRNVEIQVPEKRAKVLHDIHHPQHPRVLHEADPINMAIRRHPNSLFHIYRNYHEELHRKVIYSPPFPYVIGQRVLKNIRMGADAEDKIEVFIEAVEKALKSPRTTHLDRQLGKLSIDSWIAQAPYLIQGEYKRE